jgi:ABC-2 type transport system permease protein
MRKVLVIAAREYQASVKTKAFIISLVIMPILMGGGILIQTLLKDVGDTEAKKFAVIDWTPGEQIFPVIAAAAEHPEKIPLPGGGQNNRNQPGFIIEHVKPKKRDPEAVNQLRFELSERVRKKELFGFLEIGPKVIDPVSAGTGKPDPAHSIRYQTNTPTYQRFNHWVQTIVNTQVQLLRCKKENVDLQKVRTKILPPVPLIAKGLSEKDASGKVKEAKDQQQIAAFFVPFGLIMLMFMVIMVGATPLMQGVMEEKMQKIAEVLLGSVDPFQLMMGKLLGTVGVSLTLVAVYLGGGYYALYHFDFSDLLPVDLLIWFLVFQVMAVLMFGSLFIAIGAACTDVKETQSMMMPVMLLVCVPLMVWFHVIQEPNSSFSLWISLFPFATPMLMIARQAVPPGIPVWQPLLGVGIVLAATVLCVYAAGRIFRVGILLQGKGAKFADLFRWVFRG